MEGPILHAVFYAFRRAFTRLTRPLTVGVRCIVAREDGAVLLVRHTYRSGWYLPGGGVEKGETLQQAIRRELAEEAGISARGPLKLVHAYSSFHEGKSDHVVLFALSEFDIDFKPSLEIAEHGFFPVAELPVETSPATRRRLAEWRGQAEAGDRW